MENHGLVKLNGEILARFTPHDTDLRRSGLSHENWIDNYRPSAKGAMVVDDKKVPILYGNAVKYAGTSDYVVPPSIYRRVVNFMKERYPVIDYEELTDDGAINGVGCMDPIVINTSTGYLSKYFKNGKKELFDLKPGTGGETGVASQYQWSDIAKQRDIPLFGLTFYDHYRNCEGAILSGRAPLTFWVATLKDELRTKEKVMLGKTRIFEQPGFEYSLLVRKYFGHFISYYKNNFGFRLWHGIGADKEAVWKAYYQGLAKWDSQGFDVDYKNYDGSVPVAAFDAFRDVTDHFYEKFPESHKRARHALLHAHCNSLLIIGNNLVETDHGNKSGYPFTDGFNSFTNSFNLLVCYALARQKSGQSADVVDFDDHVAMLTYGDDVIVANSPEVRDWFNRVSVAEVSECMGLKVTSASKTGELVPTDHLHNLTFLKSPFVPVNDVILAPLPVEVIHRELQWCHKANLHDRDALRQRIDQGLAMMAHHGPTRVNALLSELRDQNVEADFDYQAFIEKIADKQFYTGVSNVYGSRDMLEMYEGQFDYEFVQNFLEVEMAEGVDSWIETGISPEGFSDFEIQGPDDGVPLATKSFPSAVTYDPTGETCRKYGHVWCVRNGEWFCLYHSPRRTHEEECLVKFVKL